MEVKNSHKQQKQRKSQNSKNQQNLNLNLHTMDRNQIKNNEDIFSFNERSLSFQQNIFMNHKDQKEKIIDFSRGELNSNQNFNLNDFNQEILY
jgi:hypothetical protein